jgi:hypothetical protein
MKTIMILSAMGGLNFSYVPGDIVKVQNDKEAESFINHKQAKPYTPGDNDYVISHPDPENEGTAGDNNNGLLPEDCPAYDLLTGAGLTTIEEVLGHEDLTELKGIGEATKKEILEFLKQE